MRRVDLPPGKILCEYCTARCCRYFALPMETPTTWADFEHCRWYLLHEHVSIFVDEEVWYLSVQTSCKSLLSDNRCGIYETRPQICREYHTKDCEYDNDGVYDLYFETPAQVYEFAEAILGPQEVRGSQEVRFRSPEPSVLPVLSL